jgi:predicted DCC family thiol-disulfide oxidoreductase YuxK
MSATISDTPPIRQAHCALSRASAYLYDLLFAPATPGNLGFCRLLFFGLMLWFHWRVDFTVWSTLPASFNNKPVALFALLHLPIVSIKTMAMLEGFWKFSLLLACVALFTRISTWASLMLGLYLLGVPHNFGKQGHGDGILVLTMGILALSRCGDAWSLDRLLRSFRAGPPIRLDAPGGEYRWPVACVWLLTALVFFAAGVTKLRWSGLEWITSDNLANVLLQHQYKSDPLVDWGRAIARHPLLCKVLAGMTVALELLFPLALFSSRARWPLVGGMFVAQVGIALLMGVVFTQFMFVYLFWIPWYALGRFVLKRVAPLWQRQAVFYDGGCGLCRKTVTVLYHLDVLRRCDIHDIANDWPAIASRFGQLEREACLIDMHVVTQRGQVYRGYDAYRSLAWALPAMWIVLPILYLPPVRWIGWKVYRHVATHRYDAGCELPQ